MFHSLRHSLATALSGTHAGEAVTMRIMRHSDPRLTFKTYTDVEHLPAAAAVRNLPGIAPERTHGRTQESDVEGRYVARPGTEGTPAASAKHPENKGDCHALAPTGTDGHDGGMERVMGVEPT